MVGQDEVETLIRADLKPWIERFKSQPQVSASRSSRAGAALAATSVSSYYYCLLPLDQSGICAESGNMARWHGTAGWDNVVHAADATTTAAAAGHNQVGPLPTDAHGG